MEKVILSIRCFLVSYTYISIYIYTHFCALQSPYQTILQDELPLGQNTVRQASKIFIFRWSSFSMEVAIYNFWELETARHKNPGKMGKKMENGHRPEMAGMAVKMANYNPKPILGSILTTGFRLFCALGRRFSCGAGFPRKGPESWNSISLENFNLALNVQSSPSQFPHKEWGLGGWLAWSFQSQWETLIFFNLWALRVNGPLLSQYQDRKKGSLRKGSFHWRDL